MVSGSCLLISRVFEIISGSIVKITLPYHYELLLRTMFRPRFRGRGFSNALIPNPHGQNFPAFHQPYQRHVNNGPFFLTNQVNYGFTHGHQPQGPVYNYPQDNVPLYNQTYPVQQVRFQQNQEGVGVHQQPGQQERSNRKRHLDIEEDSRSKRSRENDNATNVTIQDVPLPPPDYSRNSLISQKIIENFVQNHQTEQDYNRKLHLRDALYTILQGVIPNCGLYIVGSSMTGFSTTKSDMDLCLVISDQEIDQRREAVEFLYLIQRALSKCSFLSNSQVIRAKVPILRIFDLIGKIELDLNINSTVGVRNTHLLKFYSLADWRVRPLILYIKKWARFHDINDARKKTLSSYTLSLMMIHYLQCGVSPPVLPVLQKMHPDVFSTDRDIRDLSFDTSIVFKSENEQTLGDLFLGFLDYYANSFNYEEDCVSVRLGLKTNAKTASQRVTRHNLIMTYDGYQLAVEEPFDLSNTARSFHTKYSGDRVKRVIRVSFKRLNAKRDPECLFQSPF